jgi:hypothetical protein
MFGFETGTFFVCEREMYYNLNFVTKEYDNIGVSLPSRSESDIYSST